MCREFCGKKTREWLILFEGKMITMQADYGGQGTHGHVAGQSGGPATVWWGGIGSHASSPAKVHVSDVHGHVFKQVGLHVPHPMQGSGQEEAAGAQLVNRRVQIMSTCSGYDQSKGNGPQNQNVTGTVISSAPSEYLLSHSQVELGHSIARSSYPYTDPYLGGILAAYGAQAVIHSPMLGVQQARMPLQLETEEEPVYVNAKQYHGILRRRQLRAKAELENKVVKARKPYLHESRHLHAMRRARGCGGRFLNTKKLESKAQTDSEKGSQGPGTHTGSSSGSEAFHSENGNIIISQEVQGGTLGMSISEVTSMPQSYTGGQSYIYSHKHGGYLGHHQDQHFHASVFHDLSTGSHDGKNGNGGGLISKGSQQKAVAIL